MNGLILNSNGTNCVFRPDGKVAFTGAGGAQAVKGKWKSVSKREANRIQYDFDGAPAEFDVKFRFNENNQLVAVVPAAANGGADSTPFTFLGEIAIDDNRDVAYNLYDDSGVATGEKIIVHGELAFVPGLDKLTVKLAGGGKTEILGDRLGRNNLHPEPNAVAGQEDDLIRFTATTINSIAGNEVAKDADIRFGGHWDVNEKGLYFSAGLTAGEVKIQLGGTYKGVTAGLEYYAKEGDTKVAFTIHGEHHFKQPKGGEGSVNWLLKLGHSEQHIEAVAKLGVSSVDRTGNKLTLDGTFQFSKDGQETSSKMNLTLKAICEMRGGQLIFEADFQKNGSRTSYNLLLAGKYKVRNGAVTFQIKLGQEESGAQKLELSLGTTDDSKVRAHLSAVLTKSGSGETSLALNFDISARWVNGELVKPGAPPEMQVDKPKLLPAGAS